MLKTKNCFGFKPTKKGHQLLNLLVLTLLISHTTTSKSQAFGLLLVDDNLSDIPLAAPEFSYALNFLPGESLERGDVLKIVYPPNPLSFPQASVPFGAYISEDYFVNDSTAPPDRVTCKPEPTGFSAKCADEFFDPGTPFGLDPQPYADNVTVVDTEEGILSMPVFTYPTRNSATTLPFSPTTPIDLGYFRTVFGPRGMSNNEYGPATAILFDANGEIKYQSTSNPAGVIKDYGDAPDSYRTTLAADGPRYDEGDLQRLGASWDSEPDGQPTPLAYGDDLSLLGGFPNPVDDEDGVFFGDNFVRTTLNISRPGVNKYNLRAWWDNKDINGVFDNPLELAIDDTLNLTPGTYVRQYNLNFDPRETFSRFRLTYDPLDPNVLPASEFLSTDGSSHGEVEDYGPGCNKNVCDIDIRRFQRVPEPNSILSLVFIGILGLILVPKNKGGKISIESKN